MVAAGTGATVAKAGRGDQAPLQREEMNVLQVRRGLIGSGNPQGNFRVLEQGLLDLAFMRVSEMFQVVPSFIVATVIIALLGAGLTQVIIVVALLAWPQIARVIRGEVIRIRECAREGSDGSVVVTDRQRDC